jgi:hypothetical protein
MTRNLGQQTWTYNRQPDPLFKGKRPSLPNKINHTSSRIGLIRTAVASWPVGAFFRSLLAGPV